MKLSLKIDIIFRLMVGQSFSAGSLCGSVFVWVCVSTSPSHWQTTRTLSGPRAIWALMEQDHGLVESVGKRMGQRKGDKSKPNQLLMNAINGNIFPIISFRAITILFIYFSIYPNIDITLRVFCQRFLGGGGAFLQENWLKVFNELCPRRRWMQDKKISAHDEFQAEAPPLTSCLMTDSMPSITALVIATNSPRTLSGFDVILE